MGQDQFALPKLPASNRNHHQHFGIAADQLTRKKLQVLLHLITADLKTRGTKTPHVFLPFRSRVDDSKLEQFLQSVFPGGKLIDMSKTSLVKLLLKSFDEFTLICGLKYLWCRLPNNEVVGWNVYLEFKRRERDAGYPKDAFLTLMPKCLSSSSHASIVYDFLDLMIGIATNSQYNHLSGRKIAKMASVWAFNSTPHSSSAFYDATATRENSFMDGLSTWELTCNGLFHLLLAFLRAMLPDTESDTLKLPKTLQSLLVTNSYPPPDKLPSMKSVITIPCVQIRSTKRCADPYELISKVRQNLRFDKKDKFISIENYTILKNISKRTLLMRLYLH
ncbi:CIC11C00000004746 [Sungouiella intermedia]|uniref:CIC11C00000004746 n=1 Tax=Sungouiella intermedia TaxID=45354 RepID=A0A1L0BR03_9ASCO|nr:CIC11C00000004746 [[Candida] intermedia]